MIHKICLFASLITALTLAACTVTAQTPPADHPISILESPLPQRAETHDFDEYGMSMALHENLALIGASSTRIDHNGTSISAGRAYLYDLETNELLLTFDDPSPQQRGVFGKTLALNGRFALITSRNSIELFDIRDASQNTAPKSAPSIFTVGPSDTAPDYWGQRVGVGFWRDQFLLRNLHAETGAPLIEIYEIETREKRAEITDPDKDPTSDFGRTIAIDGDTLLVGAPAAGVPEHNYATGPGAVYVFDLTTRTYRYKITSPRQEEGLHAMGEVIAAQNGQALTTAHTQMPGTFPDVYYFDIDSGEILHTFRAENANQVWYFGQGLALTDDRIFLAYTHSQEMRIARIRGEPMDPLWMSPRIYVYDRHTKELLHEIRNRQPHLLNHELGRGLVANEDHILVSVSHGNLADSQKRDPVEHLRGEVRVFTRPSERAIWE